MTVGEHIKYFVKERYGSQKKAAISLGVKPSFLSMVINGKRKMPRKQQLRLIKAGMNKAVFYAYSDIKDPGEVKIEDWQSYISHLAALIQAQELLIESYENRIHWELEHKKWLRKELHATRMMLKDRIGTLPRKLTERDN